MGRQVIRPRSPDHVVLWTEGAADAALGDQREGRTVLVLQADGAPAHAPVPLGAGGRLPPRPGLAVPRRGRCPGRIGAVERGPFRHVEGLPAAGGRAGDIPCPGEGVRHPEGTALPRGAADGRGAGGGMGDPARGRPAFRGFQHPPRRAAGREPARGRRADGLLLQAARRGRAGMVCRPHGRGGEVSLDEWDPRPGVVGIRHGRCGVALRNGRSDHVRPRPPAGVRSPVRHRHRGRPGPHRAGGSPPGCRSRRREGLVLVDQLLVSRPLRQVRPPARARPRPGVPQAREEVRLRHDHGCRGAGPPARPRPGWMSCTSSTRSIPCRKAFPWRGSATCCQGP